ncbi:hypothetical protein GCM10023196_101130 [Actinoallomurus vinaceus]|uniref:Uncharacterized protein n=1 Tax=Actinoallomurus vinaceus TaxID=1080074 RepID=A0ABP8UW23_9ACTN
MQHDTILAGSDQALDLIVGDLEKDIPARDSAVTSSCFRTIYCI